MYVAITRAENKLFITRARSRYLYGNRNITAESRFLKEIMPLLDVKNVNNSYYNSQKRQPERKNNYDGDYGYYADEPSKTSSFGNTKSFTSGFVSNGSFKATVNSNQKNKYKSGMKVKHAKFGSGTIIAVKNDGKIIDVAFVGVGIKSLASEIAPLEIE